MSIPVGEPCTPNCRFFKCRQRALKWMKGRVWCTMSEDWCIGSKCNYAFCVKRKMLNDGSCGLSVKVEARKLDIEEIEREVPRIDVKVKGRASRRIRIDDLL